MLTKHMWHPVPELELIEVTRDGRIRTAAYAVDRRSRWGSVVAYSFLAREITPHMSDNGYMRIHVQRNGTRGPQYVHRLIARVFVSGYQPGFHVNHINGRKTDNRPENLEWVPLDSNVRHAWKTGLTGRRGSDVWCAKLSPRRVRAIRRALDLGVTVATIAILCEVSPNTILRIARGEAWQSVQG